MAYLLLFNVISMEISWRETFLSPVSPKLFLIHLGKKQYSIFGMVTKRKGPISVYI